MAKKLSWTSVFDTMVNRVARATAVLVGSEDEVVEVTAHGDVDEGDLSAAAILAAQVKVADAVEAGVRAELVEVPVGEPVSFSSAAELDALLHQERKVVVKTTALKVAAVEVGRVFNPPFPVGVRTPNPVQSANAAARKVRVRNGVAGRVEIIGKSDVARGWAVNNPGRVAMVVEDDLAALCQRQGR